MTSAAPIKNAAKPVLSTLEQVKQFFVQNKHPYFFIGASHFNVMTMETWVKNWHHVCLIDSISQPNPHHITLENNKNCTFDSLESINQYILNHRDFLQLLEQTTNVKAGPRASLLMLFYNPTIEAMAESLDLRIALPGHADRHEIDSKIVTTQIGERAQVASVPHILAKVVNYKSLRALADSAGLGHSLVVQLPYGDSGKTTYFIESAQDFARYAKYICAEDSVKIMKKIRCRGTAIEAVATRCGTFVGPLTDELVGYPELTPYAGGWCGNQIVGGEFTPKTRRQLVSYTERLGDALYQRGYKGAFEVDYLLDEDTGEAYLGELNPRLTGITAMTSLSRFCQARVPLLLLHLLEFREDAELAINPAQFNEQSIVEGDAETLAQLIMKYTADELCVLTQVPTTGIYQPQSDGSLHCIELTDNPGALKSGQIFVLNLLEESQQIYPGLDMAIVFIDQPMRDATLQLNDNAHSCIQKVRKLYKTRSLNAQERQSLTRYASPGSFKHALPG